MENALPPFRAHFSNLQLHLADISLQCLQRARVCTARCRADSAEMLVQFLLQRKKNALTPSRGFSFF